MSKLFNPINGKCSLCNDTAVAKYITEQREQNALAFDHGYHVFDHCIYASMTFTKTDENNHDADFLCCNCIAALLLDKKLKNTKYNFDGDASLLFKDYPHFYEKYNEILKTIQIKKLTDITCDDVDSVLNYLYDYRTNIEEVNFEKYKEHMQRLPVWLPH